MRKLTDRPESDFSVSGDGKLIFDSRQTKESEKQKPPFVLWNAGEGLYSDENPDDVPIKSIQIEHKD